MEQQQRCQLQGISELSEGVLPTANRSLIWRLKLLLKRVLPIQTKQHIKSMLTTVLTSLNIGQQTETAKSTAPTMPLQPGDWVRVRSYDEIKATLNNWNTLKGCSFMESMQPYCGTTQRVLKPVRRFLDERDYKMKKCSGLVLLDGVMCQGMKNYGGCDRSCFFFWRNEWLEKIEAPIAENSEDRIS